MKKEGILLAVVVLLIAAAFAQAEQAKPAGGDKLGVTLDFTYATRYIWRGFDRYRSNDGAIQPSIDVDLYGTGFGFKIWYSTATESGHVNLEEIEYTVYYSNTAFRDETYATDYTFAWTYYNFPDNPPKALDAQEFLGSFSWPNLFPYGVVPSYTVIKMWPAVDHSLAADAYTDSGWFHIFGLDYDWTVPQLDNRVLSLSMDLVYNDGVGAANVDHDWSHVLFGISTDFTVAENLTFTPAFYFQRSMDDSVNTSNEYWATLSLAYTF
jgi:hypothetical protein